MRFLDKRRERRHCAAYKGGRLSARQSSHFEGKRHVLLTDDDKLKDQQTIKADMKNRRAQNVKSLSHQILLFYIKRKPS